MYFVGFIKNKYTLMIFFDIQSMYFKDEKKNIKYCKHLELNIVTYDKI